ncbi:MAG: hypothetical protein ABIV47_16735 [Roseiflexaceae bacterium]
MLLEFGVVEKVNQLRREGLRPSEQLVRSITKAEHAAVGPLLSLATDLELLHRQAPESFAPLHALRLLGELGSVEIIEPLLHQFPVSLTHDEEELPQTWVSEAAQIIGNLGAPAIEPLWQIVDNADESWNMAARSGALTALGYVTAVDTDTHDAIIAGIRERMAHSEDKLLTSHLAIGLANMGVSDFYPELMAMYRAGKLDQDILPAAAARQLLLTDSTKRLACAKHPLWERYDQHGPFPAQN